MEGITIASVVYPMEGITTALVVYMLACIAIPKLVKNRPQFYIAFFGVLAIILLGALAVMIPNAGFHAVVAVFTAVIQVICLALMLMSTGGQTFAELASALGNAVDVFKGGSAADSNDSGDREVKIPPVQYTPPRTPATPAPRHAPGDPDNRRIYAIDESGIDTEIDPASGVIPATPANPPEKSDKPAKPTDGGIPLA